MAATTAPDDPPARIPSVAASDRHPSTASRSDTETTSSISPGASSSGTRPAPRPGTWRGPGGPAEDHRADGVDRHHPQGRERGPEAAGEAEDRARGADRDDEAVEGPVEVGQDLARRAVVVGLPVALVGVLVDPQRSRDLLAQGGHPAEAAVEVATMGVGFGDELDPGAEVLEDPEVGRGGLGVDDAGEVEVVDPGGGGQGDPEVARRALHQVGGGGDRAVGQAPGDDVGRRAVLHAPARVHQLELGDDRRPGRRELPAQFDQRSPPDARRH